MKSTKNGQKKYVMSHLFFLLIIEFKFFKYKKKREKNNKNEGCHIFQGQNA